MADFSNQFDPYVSGGGPYAYGATGAGRVVGGRAPHRPMQHSGVVGARPSPNLTFGKGFDLLGSAVSAVAGFHTIAKNRRASFQRMDTAPDTEEAVQAGTPAIQTPQIQTTALNAAQPRGRSASFSQMSPEIAQARVERQRLMTTRYQ